MGLDGHPAIRVETPGKLNLFLEVLARRDDGFHELEMLMVAISNYDSLYFTSQESPRIAVQCEWDLGYEAHRQFALHGVRPDGARNLCLAPLPQDAANLVGRALELFRGASGVSAGASVRLVKRIPTEAGLGGGSSDAAAALVAANDAWRVGWKLAKLADFAGQIGSDVPFFLSSSTPYSVCRGRGEQIEPQQLTTRLDFVIVKPPFGLSTADVYRRVVPPEEPRSVTPCVAAIRSGNRSRMGDLMFNRLTEAAGKLTEWMQRLHGVFQGVDVLGHQMSGSGSAYFAICRHRRHALRIAGRLRALDLGQVFTAYSTMPLARIAMD